MNNLSFSPKKVLIILGSVFLLVLALSGCLTFTVPVEQPTTVVVVTTTPVPPPTDLPQIPTEIIIPPTLPPAPVEQQPTTNLLLPTDKPIPTDIPELFPGNQPGNVPTVYVPPQPAIYPTTTTINGLGQRVDRNGMALTAVSAQLVANFDNLSPAEGNTFILIYVRIENTGNPNPLPFNPVLFTLRDGNGVEYGLTSSVPNPVLPVGVLNPGEAAEGYIAYEIPTGTTGLVLSTDTLASMGFSLIRIQIIN